MAAGRRGVAAGQRGVAAGREAVAAGQNVVAAVAPPMAPLSPTNPAQGRENCPRFVNMSTPPVADRRQPAEGG